MGEYSKEKEDALQRALFFMVPSILFALSISIYFFFKISRALSGIIKMCEYV